MTVEERTLVREIPDGMAPVGPQRAEPLDDNADNPSVVHDQPIGDIIRRVKDLSPDQVARILTHQREHGVRFGEAAVALGFVSNDDVLWALAQQFHYPYAPDGGAPFVDAELVVAANPFSDQSEAFRDLRSQLMMGVLAPGDTRRAIAVVSSNVGDGKTFMAANLAVAFSQLGGRTLLIDADMRTPRQHRIFGVDNASGLSTMLSGRSEAGSIHHVKNLPSLWVLPVGTVPPNPLELLQRPAFGLLLKELLSKFDHVVVDTPAAVHGADARVAAAACGAALVIGRVDKSRMDAMQGLIARLKKSPAQVAGVVMNDY
jgi:protein-tyrosine kinase